MSTVTCPECGASFGTEPERLVKVGLRLKRRFWGIALAFWAVVIVVVGALLQPGERPSRRTCTGNLKQLGYALHLYSSDNDELFPASLGRLFPEYSSDGRLLLCPRAGRRSRPIRVEDLPAGVADASAVLLQQNTDYVYMTGLTAGDHHRCIVVFDKQGTHEGHRCVCFVGGNVEWITEREFQEILPKTVEYLATRDARVFEQ